MAEVVRYGRAAIVEVLDSDRLAGVVASLGKESRAALAFVVERGGSVMVGRMAGPGGGMYRTAKVPPELRGRPRDLLRPGWRPG